MIIDVTAMRSCFVLKKSVKAVKVIIDERVRDGESENTQSEPSVATLRVGTLVHPSLLPFNIIYECVRHVDT